MYTAYKNGSLAEKIAKVIIGKIPYIGAILDDYETTLTEAALNTGVMQYYESDYTVQINASIEDLNYARNNVSGGVYDYIGLTGYAQDCNYIRFGYEFGCSTS